MSDKHTDNDYTFERVPGSARKGLLPMFFMLVTSGTAVFTMFLTNANKWMKHGFAEGGVTAISAAILFLLCLTLLVLGGFCLRRIIKHRINEAIKRMVKE